MFAEFSGPKWVEKYRDIVVDGLSDGPTYVQLAVRDGVQLVYRPRTNHNDEGTDFLGKLSAFPEEPDSKTADELHAAFPIKATKWGDHRVGTDLRIAIDPLPYYDVVQLIKTSLVPALVKELSKKFNVKIGKRASQALIDAYTSQFDQVTGATDQVFTITDH